MTTKNNESTGDMIMRTMNIRKTIRINPVDYVHQELNGVAELAYLHILA